MAFRCRRSGPTESILLEFLGEVEIPKELNAATLRRFFQKRAQRHGISRTKTVACAMRMLIRFLAVHGRCPAGLLGAFPPIAQWRLSSLPVYVSARDVERIVAAAAPISAVGRRDRAILLLLARLGLRAGDIVEMRLQDIDWAAGTVRMEGKGKRPARLPLPQDVGDAILAYLADGRPAVKSEYVFLTVQAPLTRFHSSTTVSFIVRRAAGRARVTLPRQGAHVLRHSAATALVRTGVSLHAVGILLRHRGEEATAHYAKVDVPALLRIAQPWPGEVSPC